MSEERESRYTNSEPIGAPYAKGSDTSREAAQAKVGRIAEERTKVYLAVIRAGSSGATWDELVERLDLSPTANGRITELRELGLIIDSGRRRKTRRGRNAAVYVVAPAKAVSA